MSRACFKKASDSSISRGQLQTSLDGDSSSLIGHSLRMVTRRSTNARRRSSIELVENIPGAAATNRESTLKVARDGVDIFGSIVAASTAAVSAVSRNGQSSIDYIYRNSTISSSIPAVAQQQTLIQHRQGRGKRRRVWGGDAVVVIKSSRALNERKALKVLIIIFSIFVIFWSPFFIINLISVYCTECEFITKELFLAITYLGYASSTLNPIIYTMFNKNFRRAFINLLRCRTIPLKKHERFLVLRNAHENSRSQRLL